MKYDIEGLKRKMLVKYPFFGSVVTNVDYKEDTRIPTAGTDGKTIYYNPEYLEKLARDDQVFIIAHEVCHIAFNHILRSDGKDKKLWNIATDAVINQQLKRDGLRIPSDGIDIAEAINYDAEQLYEKLLQKKKQEQQSQSQQQSSSSQSSQQNEQQNNNSKSSNNQQQSQSQQQSSSSQNSQQNEQQNKDTSEQRINNTHDMWEEAVKKHKEEQSKSSNKKRSLLDKLLGKNKKDKEDKKDEEKSELEKQQEELENMGEKDGFKKNREDYKKQLEELKQSIAKQVSQPAGTSPTAGTSTNSDIRQIKNIGTSKPLIDWRYILRETIKYDVDWSYKNATIEDGVIVAHLEEQPMPETEILLDTSGSINEVLLKNFVRACKNILPYSRLKIGCFDTKFYGFNEIRTEKDIENMKFVGGGGTDFDVAVGSFSRRVENKIIFTDGYADMPKKPLDAIWMVFGPEMINPKGGRVIHITPEQLEKLYSPQSNDKKRVRSRY